MKIIFEKYHGAGNDFILIDNREKEFDLTREQIAFLCHRHYGIGADGLILIQHENAVDFEMIYYNSDGGLGSMCGNGGRCAARFAQKHRIIRQSARFKASDGIHEVKLSEDGTVKLSISSVKGFTVNEGGDYVLNTGSPHLVRFVPSVNNMDVVAEGRNIRYNEPWKKVGINVNFVSRMKGKIEMRTYERGVEDETLSCGTGTVAAALAVAVERDEMNSLEYSIEAPGGLLKVSFDRKDKDVFEDIWLEGPVSFVFEGMVKVG